MPPLCRKYPRRPYSRILNPYLLQLTDIRQLAQHRGYTGSESLSARLIVFIIDVENTQDALRVPPLLCLS